MDNLKTMLFNAVTGWYDDSMESYHGLDDAKFVERVCSLTGMTTEDYFELMNPKEVSNKEEWIILSNNSAYDDLSIYKVSGTQHDAYRKMQALLLSKVVSGMNNEIGDAEIFMDSSELEGHIQWNDMHEEFRILKTSDITKIDDVDGILEISLDAIPEDLSWDADICKKFLFAEDLENITELTFEKMLRLLGTGKTFEDIAVEYSDKKHQEVCNVECSGNKVYDDQDLYDFLEELGAHITDYGVEYALIETDDNQYFEIPYKEYTNRHGEDLPEETVLFFDKGRIYDVTDERA